MEKRLLKQILIATIFFVFLIGISLLIYFALKPKPTCFDKIKNQNEVQVDCDGLCQPCRLVNKSLELKSAYAILYDNRADLVARILNSETEYGVNNFKYTFKITDPLGGVQEFTGEDYRDFILPAESKFIIRQGLILTTPWQPGSKIDFEIDPASIVWINPRADLLKLNQTFLPISNVVLEFPKATDIKNKTYYNFTKWLQKGSTGDQVGDLQKVLATIPNIYAGKVTGKYDAKVVTAVKAFQKKYGLRTNGVLDKGTRTKLNELFGKPITGNNDNIAVYDASAEVSGQVMNNTSFNWVKVKIAILLCVGDEYVAAGSPTLDNLTSSKQDDFVYRWYRTINPKAKICERAAYTNVFDQNNFIQIY